MKARQLGANKTEVELDDRTIFFSYETPVAVHVPGKTYVTREKYSVTTSKHINQWLHVNGFSKVISVSQEDLDNIARGTLTALYGVCLEVAA